jgi:hypothetical protein
MGFVQKEDPDTLLRQGQGGAASCHTGPDDENVVSGTIVSGFRLGSGVGAILGHEGFWKQGLWIVWASLPG